MTRFLITLDQSVDFVIRSLASMLGGEIFVPKIPSVNVVDLARVIAPDCRQEVIGIRPGEKLHEAMIGEDDARLTLEYDQEFVVQPSHSLWSRLDYAKTRPSGRPCAEGFSYCSDTNPWYLTDEEVAALVVTVEKGPAIDTPPSSTEPRFIVGG